MLQTSICRAATIRWPRRIVHLRSIRGTATMTDLSSPTSPPPPPSAAMAALPLQLPEQAHLEGSHSVSRSPRSPISNSHNRIEDELSNAMRSPLFQRRDLAGPVQEPDSYFSTESLAVSRPESLALPPKGRRNTATRPLLRQRSMSAGSIDGLSGDPYAWLRQTVQEQRENPVMAPQVEWHRPAGSAPTSPTSESSQTVKPDYFGAGLMSLIAGKGPVKEHVTEDVRRKSVDGGSSSMFSMPALPSLPKLQAPALPTFQAPSMPAFPKFQAPSLPDFKAPSLPDFKGPWMPEGISKQLGMSSGEGEIKKYMDKEDQTADDEPDWARIKAKYDKPMLPMVFLHGLFGFSVIGPQNVPALQIQYWRGVREALEELGVEVLMTASPASGNIETRAKAVAEQIAERFPGREVNICGHSMGGLDARYLITHIQPEAFTIRSLTTIATPHHGSPFADYLLDDVLGRQNLPSLLAVMKAIQMPGGGRAFDALTTTKMAQFNIDTPDDPSVQYFSYGAQFRPSFVDPFRLPWSIIFEKEGENDGLVSVDSCKWGNYQGTVENVSHLDLVGWVGKMRFLFAEYSGKGIKFKPVSFYLTIAEMLASKGL